MIRGTFTGLRAVDRPDVVTGVLWIPECEATNSGSHLTFRVAIRAQQRQAELEEALEALPAHRKVRDGSARCDRDSPNRALCAD